MSLAARICRGRSPLWWIVVTAVLATLAVGLTVATWSVLRRAIWRETEIATWSVLMRSGAAALVVLGLGLLLVSLSPECDPPSWLWILAILIGAGLLLVRTRPVARTAI